MNKPIRAPKKPFVLEEATIDELHTAIKAGETTCVDVVRPTTGKRWPDLNNAAVLDTDVRGPDPGCLDDAPVMDDQVRHPCPRRA